MSKKNYFSYVGLILKRVFFRSTYSSFSLSLIAVAIGLLIPDFREFIINLVIDGLNYAFEAAGIPEFKPEESYWPQVVAIILICMALSIFWMGWRLDQRINSLMVALERKPSLRIYSNPSWIHCISKDKNKINPLISTTVYIALDTGAEPIYLHSVDFCRYVEGCRMLSGEPFLRNSTSGETYNFIGDWENLSTPVVIRERTSAVLTLSRQFQGPTPNYYYNDMEEGDLRFIIRFRIGRDSELTEDTRIFHQVNGSLTETGELQRPPLLNDSILSEALNENKITQEQYDRVTWLEERRRFLFLRDGEQYLLSHPDLRDRKNLQALLLELHERLR